MNYEPPSSAAKLSVFFKSFPFTFVLLTQYTLQHSFLFASFISSSSVISFESVLATFGLMYARKLWRFPMRALHDFSGASFCFHNITASNYKSPKEEMHLYSFPSYTVVSSFTLSPASNVKRVFHALEDVAWVLSLKLFSDQDHASKLTLYFILIEKLMAKQMCLHDFKTLLSVHIFNRWSAKY